MCGIIGYAGVQPAGELLLSGLERLEYRGYDSSGLSLVEEGGLLTLRSVGSLEGLGRAAREHDSDATTGLGHTRWATHGGVELHNAHPLAGCEEEELSLVLNGIVENHLDLRAGLVERGHGFRSDTDAEVVAHLVEEHYRGDLVQAVAETARRLEGHFAFVVCHHEHPSILVAARRHCPLVVGVAEHGTFLASAISAFSRETRRVQHVLDGEVVVATPAGAVFFDASGAEIQREVDEVDWSDEWGEKDGHETFMEKEIAEQPRAIAETLAGRVTDGRVTLDDLGLPPAGLAGLDRVVIVACGTAYHAAVSARYAIEAWARVPCEPDIASEWRYREPVLSPRTLVIGISQSGETADTLAALRLARAQGAHTVAITNMPGSQITREADRVLFTRAGIEMGVAATKTFTAQVALLFVVALHLAEARGTLSPEGVRRLALEVESMPSLVERFLRGSHPIDDIAHRHAAKPFFLYLGRHIGLPICLEGALKLKEISYIPTEAYSAGEMKHGPIALLDENVPVVCVATDSHVYEKVVSNLAEVRARGAYTVAIASDGNEEIQHLCDDVVYVPRAHPIVQAVIAVVPLQLLALRVAQLRGLSVDRPRNLAKTVTVE